MDNEAFTHLHYVVVKERPVRLAEGLASPRCKEQLNVFDVQGRTPLHWACSCGDADDVKTLVDAGADLNIKDNHGLTPLIIAAGHGNVTMIKKLLNSGACIRDCTKRGDSPLHFACKYQNEVAPVRALVEAGISVNRKNNLRNTAFAGAAVRGRSKIGRYLIQIGAIINTRGAYGDTPVLETIYHNRHDFLKMLLEHEAPTTDVNHNNNTILHAVGFEGDNETVSILCNSGVTLPRAQAKNKFGEDALAMFGKRLKVPEGFETLFRQLLTQAGSS